MENVMEQSTIETEKHPGKHTPRRYALFGMMAIAAVLTAFFFARQQGRTDVAASSTPAQPSPDVIDATPDQLKQIRVEAVRDQEIELDLETTGKVGFNEDRLTPVFAPYTGRVVEIL